MTDSTGPAPDRGEWPNQWPGPIDPAALHSRSYRDQRSRHLATWAGIRTDGIDDFAARMELSWTRQIAAEVEEANARLHAAERRRADLDASGDVVRLRNGRLQRLRPRKADAA